MCIVVQGLLSPRLLSQGYAGGPVVYSFVITQGYKAAS